MGSKILNFDYGVICHDIVCSLGRKGPILPLAKYADLDLHNVFLA